MPDLVDPQPQPSQGQVVRRGAQQREVAVDGPGAGGRRGHHDPQALDSSGLNMVDLGAFEDWIGRELVAQGVQTPDAVKWVLDSYNLESEVIGATWAEVKAWERGEGTPPPGVWPTLLAAVAPRALAGE